jgi:PAS domain S-box-containing protein
LRSAQLPSTASLVALLETVPALVWETDADLRVTCMTGVALEAMHVSAERYAGRPVEALFSTGGDAHKAWRAHESALLGKDSIFEAEVHGRDLQASVKPLRGPDGAIAGVVGIALDMTEHVVSERAWRLSEHGYRTLVEEAPYAICRCTIGGELLQVNRAMMEMLGYEDAAGSALLLRDLPLIFSPDDAFAAFQKALLDKGSHPAVDGVWLRREGQPIQVRVSGLVVRDPNGAISHLDIFAENVTEKKQLEAELSQVQRMQAIGQLAGGVAHDFNNLLTVISGHVELMLSRSREATSRERLEEIKQAADKAASLTRQLLAFSRRQVLQSRNIDLNDVIARFMRMLNRLLKASVELTFVPGDNLGRVKADPSEIDRVLLNLAVNAQDAMPSGGRLTIETANMTVTDQASISADELQPGEYVVILVRDTGVGMNRETRARAFEPFFTTKQPNEGTGLGLSVVYGVVRQSGGYISLESEPGKGTTFRIWLPRLAATSDPAPVYDLPTPRTLPRGSETILVAEDDPAIRRLMVRALEGLGYCVLSAADGVAAMSVAQSHAGGIHILLSDLVMPALGGRELAATLQSMVPDLKVIFISGYAGHTVASRKLELEGACFLQKPFPMDLLANTIRRVLDGSLP